MIQESEPVLLPQPWGTMIWLAGADVGNIRTMTLGRMLMQPGSANDLHSHANCEEVLHVLSGQVEHRIGTEKFLQTPGTVVVVPAGVPHQTVNIGSERADILIAFPVGEREFRREEQQEHW